MLSMTRTKCSYGLGSEDEAVCSFGVPNKQQQKEFLLFNEVVLILII